MLPAEKSEVKLQHHFLILWNARVAERESAYRSGRFSPYKKYPNTITTCLPGIRPAARSRFNHEVIVGALHPDFIVEMEDELDKRPTGGFRQLYGTDAPDLRNLLRLLLKESERGGPCGALYAESLMAALATRLLYAARSEKPPATTRISRLTNPFVSVPGSEPSRKNLRLSEECDGPNSITLVLSGWSFKPNFASRSRNSCRNRGLTLQPRHAIDPRRGLALKYVKAVAE
jgi:hypothetical protein